MRYHFLYFYFISAYILGFCMSLHGTTTTGNLAVSATVTNACLVTATSPVAFGIIDGSFTSSTLGAGSVTVLCTLGEPYTISLGPGQNPITPAFTFRQMTDGSGNFISYQLFSDSNRTILWGNGVNFGNPVIGLVGTGLPQLYPVYGQIPSGQAPVPSGAYLDTVLVTVTYN
jgi:spore coat protein U-like protein